MAVTIWSIELDPNADVDHADAPLASDLVVEIRRRDADPTWAKLREAPPVSFRLPESRARRLRVRRLPA